MNNKMISIIGLGYVGLPLAIEFSKKYSVVGFDIDKTRIKELNNNLDRTNEISSKLLSKYVKKRQDTKLGLYITSNQEELEVSNIYIITVPTPVDSNKNPDLKPLILASKMVGKYLKVNDIVIYESTVYPGCTEEVCVPLLEEYSGLKYNNEFYCGYSPERINPGDKIYTIKNIKKITSGSTPVIADSIDKLYGEIIIAGTFKAKSIKIAETAKVIENSQRDINIAFVNELAKICSLLEIDTLDVLDAAGSKWNFLPFKPGLVGGHCIGVDPFYLAHKSKQLGYIPEIVLAGRRVNDSMPKFICSEVIKLLIKENIKIKNSNCLILGITFKENCPDIRNSKVIKLHNELINYGLNVDVYDPIANKKEVNDDYRIKLVDKKNIKSYDLIILSVPHSIFSNINLEKLKKKKSVVYDVKGFFNKNNVNKRL